VSSNAYLDALKLLARRELSEAQVRQRLARRQHDQDAIDDAITRLKADGSLSDERVAGAIARSEANLKKRARARVTRKIRSAGVAPDIARRAVEDVFRHVDEDQHLEAALDRRLRGRFIADEAEFRRLFRFLVSQGFDTDRVLALLERRRLRAN